MHLILYTEFTFHHLSHTTNLKLEMTLNIAFYHNLLLILSQSLFWSSFSIHLHLTQHNICHCYYYKDQRVIISVELGVRGLHLALVVVHQLTCLHYCMPSVLISHPV